MTGLSRRQLLGGTTAGGALLALGGLLTACAPTPPPDLANALDVRDFGAVGDGSTIDTAAFTAAFAALGAEGGTVYVPPGTYEVVDIRPPAGCTLTGAGHRSVLHLPSGSNRNLCTITTSNVTVTRLRLDGNRDGQSNVCNALAFWAPATNGRVEACEVLGAKGYNIVAFPGVTDVVIAHNFSSDGDEELIECQGAHRMAIVGNHCINAGKNAIYAWGNTAQGFSASDVTIAANIVSGWAQVGADCAGIRVEDGTSNVVIVANAVDGDGAGDGGKGIGVSGTTGPQLTAVTVAANTVDRTPGLGIAAQNAVGAVLHANVIDTAGDLGVRIDRNAAATVVSANVISDCAASGIGMLAAHDFTVRANVCVANGTAQSNPEYNRNGIVLWGTAGDPDPPLRNGAVLDNRCVDDGSGAQVHGLAVVNRVWDVVMDGNALDGNAGVGSWTYSPNLTAATTTLPGRQIRGVSANEDETAVPHGLGFTPTTVHVTLTSPTRIWMSSEPDETNIYLTAAADGATCDVLVG